MSQSQQSETEVYQGQFGEFTITQSDRIGVIIYRTGLMVAALSFAIGTWLVLGTRTEFLSLQSDNSVVLRALTPLYAIFCLALGISLITIHIYLAPLHRLLQIFWGIGVLAAAILAVQSNEPLALLVYNHPITLLGVGFTFAALTGIYFKEAFCFNRLETKLLMPLVPALLLGKLAGVLPLQWESVLLGVWAVLFLVFALRKVMQPIPPDIGDKSVFAYLQEQRSARA
ncbi:MAG TPA: DUF2301 domain-containing membrane protein [Candidatus Obscuribacterales bacterium]